MHPYTSEARERAAGIGRVADAVRSAVGEGRPLDRDWPAAAEDLVDVLGELCDRALHPDLVDLAQSAVMALAGLWMSTEAAESVYLGEPG